jgi:molybdopterin molybdotransferase
VITVAEAQARVLALVRPLPSETVPLARAAGRYLAVPAVARFDQPPFDAAAMDGWAVAGEAPPGAVFRSIGVAQAGRRFDGRVGPGEAVRIFTGAPVPEGATRVVIQEDATEADGRVSVTGRPGAATHIRPAGQDFRAGERFAPRRLRPADVAALAAMGHGTAEVARRPVVAVIATGDELVNPGETPGPDQIVATNSLALAAMAEAEGAEVRRLPIARDSAAHLAQVLQLAAGADLIVTTGGASVGAHDLVAGVAAGLGMEVAFHRVALRPGKPLLAGNLFGGVLLGLPGNPVSATVCGHLFMLPLIRALQGDPAPLPLPRRAVLAVDLPANGPRAHYMRATLEETGDLPRIRPFDRQDSALLSVLAAADALLVRDIGEPPRQAGARVAYLPL